MKHLIFLITSIIITGAVLAQPAPPVEWIKTHNGSNSFDEAVSMKVDAAGNSYVTGRCFLNGTSDFCTIKYNTNGVQQWIAYYNGSANISDIPTDIDIDAQGNVYVAGYSNYSSSYPFETGDYCTIKYSPAGAEMWVRTYHAQNNKRDIATSIAADGLGNVYVTGGSWFDNVRADDIVTIKYNSFGQVLWMSVYDGNGIVPESDAGKELVVDPQGNVFVFGTCTNLITWYDMCLVKYSPQGVQLSIAFYTGAQNNITDYGVALTLDNSGNVYAAGVAHYANADIVTIKFSQAGVIQWSKVYDGGGLDDVTDVTADAFGNVYVSGSKSAKGLILKYSSTGNLEWAKEISVSGGNEIINSLLTDAAGDVYGTGKIAAGTYFDIITVKVNPLGVTQWQATHNGSGNQSDAGNAIGMDGSGNVYAAGFIYETGQNGNFCTIKYAPGTIGIDPVSSEIPADFNLSQNYPNPFNPTTNIEFAIPKVSFVKLVVYDMQGRVIETLVNEQLEAGTYKTDWNASGYASGVYFYSLQTEGFTHTKKMILIK